MQKWIYLFFIFGMVPLKSTLGNENLFFSTFPELKKIDSLSQHNLEEAELKSENWLTHPSNSNNSNTRKWVWSNLALIHYKKENLSEALLALQKAIEINGTNPYVNASVLYTDALISMHTHNETHALPTILNAIEISETHSFLEKLAQSYTVLSRIYNDLGNDSLAQLQLHKSIAIHRRSQNSKALAGDLHNLAILISKNNPDSALQLINHACQLNIQAQNHRWLANNYFIKSLIFLNTNHQDSAENYAYKALYKYQNIPQKSMEASSLGQLGQIKYHFKEYPEAIRFYKKAIGLYEQIPLNEHLISLHRSLSNVFYDAQNFDSARWHSNKYIELKDQLQQTKNQDILEIIALRKEMEMEKNALMIENKEITLQNREKNLWILGLVGALTLVFLLLFNIYRWRKLDQQKNAISKKLLSKEIELKNKELTLAVLGQFKQTQSLHSLEEKLTKLQSKANKTLQPKISEILSDVKKDNGPLLWKEFELRFVQVHNDFYEKLKHMGPTLTPAEIKVCSFLKLGMNSKEISALLFKSVASIEVDRARIRKKLGLTNTKTNLSSFIIDL